MLMLNGEEEARLVHQPGLKRMQVMLGLRQDRERVPENWEAKRNYAQIRPCKDSKSGDHESGTDFDRMKLLWPAP